MSFRRDGIVRWLTAQTLDPDSLVSTASLATYTWSDFGTPAWLLILGVTLEAIELEGLGFLICKMKRMLLATSEHFCEYLMSL